MQDRTSCWALWPTLEPKIVKVRPDLELDVSKSGSSKFNLARPDQDRDKARMNCVTSPY
jgi:hypothetical protein